MNLPVQGRVTQILQALDRGDPNAASELLPLVYEALRRLARARMAKLPPNTTLQPTALVHEAYLRLVGREGDQEWKSRGHFFGAAALAMRRILVEQARRKASLKRGGEQKRICMEEADLCIEEPSEDILALDEALDRLEEEDPGKAKIVMLRYFAGLTREEAAAAMGISLRTCDRQWRYILARLQQFLSEKKGPDRDDV